MLKKANWFTCWGVWVALFVLAIVSTVMMTTASTIWGFDNIPGWYWFLASVVTDGGGLFVAMLGTAAKDWKGDPIAKYLVLLLYFLVLLILETVYLSVTVM